VGAPIRRYGEVIGYAKVGIAAGELVHVHNLDSKNVAAEYEPSAAVPTVDFHPPDRMRHFDGYARPDGRVGTRNYVALVSTVNCSASVTQFVRERFRDVQRDFPGVDGVIALTHKSAVRSSAGHRVLERAPGARHPNVAAMRHRSRLVNQAPPVARHELSLVPIHEVQISSLSKKRAACAKQSRPR
jgi:altronate hydrolase